MKKKKTRNLFSKVRVPKGYSLIEHVNMYVSVSNKYFSRFFYLHSWFFHRSSNIIGFPLHSLFLYLLLIISYLKAINNAVLSSQVTKTTASTFINSIRPSVMCSIVLSIINVRKVTLYLINIQFKVIILRCSTFCDRLPVE